MPQIQKVLTLDVTPESFLENCSVTELMETSLLVMSPRFQSKIKQHLKDVENGLKPNSKKIKELIG